MDILSQIRSCLDAATSQPGLVKASVYQTEGYLKGLQGLPWDNAAAARPSHEDPAACFLHDVRAGDVPLRGRLKKDAQACLEAFQDGMLETFPEAKGKPFAGSVVRLWVRWSQDDLDFSRNAGRRVGEKLKEEYEEGEAGNLLPFLLDKRLHLGSVRDFLRMRGWLQGTIEFLRKQPDAESRERAEILAANFSSIVLRALHNEGAGYAAKTVQMLSSMMKHIDQAIRNLAALEPEASSHLRNNRSTIITQALHSGNLDYAGEVAEKLPAALKDLNQQIDRLETSSPEDAGTLRSNKRSVVYRALTNGRLDYLQDKGELNPEALKILPPGNPRKTQS